MSAHDFLTHHVPGYVDLTLPERQAVADFTLLWSVMEGRVLHSNKSMARELDTLVDRLSAEGRLPVAKFAPALTYFRSRYFSSDFTEKLIGLRLEKLRPEGFAGLVRTVLDGSNDSPVDGVKAVLFIIYRLRNNLFHGSKWNDGLQDQLENFTHSNDALMVIIELHPAN